MSGPLDRLSDEARDALRRRAQPRSVEPMLARLTHDRFSDPDWIFERKLDGERCLAFRKGGRVDLRSRNDKELNDTYPELAAALRRGDGTWIVDGEVVAFRGAVTSFERLQGRMQVSDPDEARATGIKVYYYLFDILHLDGHDTTAVPLRERKKLLRAALPFRDPIRFTAHRNAGGESYLREACRKGWEGLIAKRADGRYVHGRSPLWLKFKCGHRQEFVIGGFTDPRGSREGFGALLIGYHEDGELRYAGKVGTGFDERTLQDLHRRLARSEVDEPPFADEKLPRKGVHWVRPRLVGEFGYTELTRERRLRHPRFLGLRRDKDPRRVRLEEDR